MAIISNEEFGSKIRVFRLQAGLTQEKLAEELGITFQQVQKYESGATKVNLVKLQQIAEVLNIPVSAFFEDSFPTICQHNDSELKLLKAFRDIKETHLQTSVIDIVTGLARRKKNTP